jgi:hypothetical protein
MKRDFKTKEKDNISLRRSVGKDDDQFFQGHDVRTPRDGGREPGPWMLDGYALRKFLLKQFPLSYVACGREPAGDHRELVTGCGGSNPRCQFCRQFRRAALWMFVIQVCFRMGLSAEAAADYWNWDHYAGRRAKPRRDAFAEADVTNTDRAYWRKVLGSHGLGKGGGSSLHDGEKGEYDDYKPIDAAYVRRLIQLITEAAGEGEKPTSH